MKKEDINLELISKIEIQIEDTLFYMPGETVKGNIVINPKFQMEIDDKILHLTLRIMQYEFWEYLSEEIKELKNIYITNIQEEEIKYKLQDELEQSKQEQIQNFTIIEKLQEDKKISIPFHIKIDDKKILPTFQYSDKVYFLGIRHLLIVESKEYNSSNYIGLFIGKNKNIELLKPKVIKETYIIDIDTLDITAKFPKLCYQFGEEMNIDIKANSNLHMKKVMEMQQLFYRKIEWVGIMKNTVIDRKIYDTQTFKYSEVDKEYVLFNKISLPKKTFSYFLSWGIAGNMYGMIIGYNGLSEDLVNDLVNNRPAEYVYSDSNQNVIGGIIGGIIGVPVGIIAGLFGSIIEKGRQIKDNWSKNENQIKSENKFVPKIENPEYKKLLIQNLEKFVYFKDNKIVGFIKFTENITPPVNGYYFNCKYNVKIEVSMAGIILNRNRYLKTHIDIYDSDEYISNMKKIFETKQEISKNNEINQKSIFHINN